MHIPVAIYARTNVDWRTMSEERFMEQERYTRSAKAMRAEDREHFLRMIRLWNRTFGVSYFEYRQRLREIAELSWSRVRDLDLLVRQQDLYELLEARQQYIVLPVDDDDWFHPDVANVVREHWRPELDVLHWPDGVFCSVPFQDRFEETAALPRLRERHWKGNFTTNGYALTKKGLAQCAGDLRKRVVLYHLQAGEIFHGEQFRRRFIDRPLSVTNKSLASCVNLRQMSGERDLLRNVAHLARRTADIPPPLAWAAEHVSLTENLNRELCRAQSVGPNGSLPPPRNHVQLLNYLVRTRGYRSYLAVGCGRNITFDAVSAPHKVGIDPQRGGTLRLPYDEFFRINQERFDLIFIDRLHLCEQVLREARNALACLNQGGAVVIHDCLPTCREHQERQPRKEAWTGDVWKAVVQLRQSPDCDVAVLDAGWGLAIVLARPNSDRLIQAPPLTWETYLANRDRILRVMAFDQIEIFLPAPNG